MDIRIRAASPADARPMARVHVDTYWTTYAGIMPAEYLAGLSYRDTESWWERVLSTYYPATSTFVAETDSGEVVGFARGGPEREGNRTYPGELYTVYLLEAYQRRGIGRRLVSAVAQRLLANGLSSMLVWVLKRNRPGRRFYESLGAQPIGQTIVTIGGARFVEMRYGWKDITGLTVERDPYSEVLA